MCTSITAWLPHFVLLETRDKRQDKTKRQETAKWRLPSLKDWRSLLGLGNLVQYSFCLLTWSYTRAWCTMFYFHFWMRYWSVNSTQSRSSLVQKNDPMAITIPMQSRISSYQNVLFRLNTFRLGSLFWVFNHIGSPILVLLVKYYAYLV